MSIQQIKTCIRRDILEQRHNLPQYKKEQASQQICAKILALPEYQKAQHVASYYAVNGEVDLALLWGSTPTHKIHYLPKCTVKKSILFLPFTPATLLHTNPWGIPEPSVPNEQGITGDDIQIIFLPLVAFDMHGTRLGMGGGYYDRYLANNNHSIRIGVAYAFQKCAYIPPDPWDIPLHAVITEISAYWFSKPNLL
jgi:5-formyltetrahydrofolate cyclo-ligase